MLVTLFQLANAAIQPVAGFGPSPGAPCLNSSNPHFVCPAPCFCNASAAAQPTAVTKNITFSAKYRLELDLYQPSPDVDTRRARPAVVAIHGGGFPSANRLS